MPGYIDSITMPLHLPASAFKPSTSGSSANSNNKGKGKATNQDAIKEGQYDVVANWNANDHREVEKMVKMASLR